MRIALFESIATPGGHEVDFDRILTEELAALGHEVCFYVPQKHVFRFDYGVPVRYLPGDSISYEGRKGVGKILAAARKELARQQLYGGLFRAAQKGEFDAVIVPTSTYRYLRALNWNALKMSPAPIIFIQHGLNPREVGGYMREAERLAAYPNIKLVVLTLADSVFGRRPANVHCVYPPAYIPRDLDGKPAGKKTGPLKLGFFGQYRREKNLDAFLDTFIACRFARPAELVVQGATVDPDDAADFARVIKKYGGKSGLSFLHRGLVGREWQEAIAGLDALVMPYVAERYRYHWSGMLFTAIGYRKPVVASSTINPEVFSSYDIGVAFPSLSAASLGEALEKFVNTYDAKAGRYEEELARANAAFSPAAFARRLVGLLAAERS